MSVELPAVRPVSRHGRGAHQRDGIVMLQGPGVAPGPIGRVSLYDIAPTLAWAMGSSILRGDGRVLYEAFDSAAAAGRPARFADSRAVDRAPDDAELDEEAVSTRLKALGYI